MKELSSIERLIDSLAHLPSVGKKSAERMAYAILNMEDETIQEMANAIMDLKKNVKSCPVCGLYTENNYCEICQDSNRDHSTLIVVSYPKDAFLFEKLGSYNGLYHVLNGNISAIKGIDINDLNIESLMSRIEKESIKEIIIATDPTIEGETTALYLAKLLKDKNIIISRLAFGLPIGGRIDYADSLTISKALEGRKKI